MDWVNLRAKFFFAYGNLTFSNDFFLSLQGMFFLVLASFNASAILYIYGKDETALGSQGHILRVANVRLGV